MNDVRVGVVGVGALGRHHARILSEMPGVKLVAVADAHPDRGREVAARHETRWVADYRQMLPDVDAVSIVVPTVAHLSVASDFLRAGIPVLVEKPLADSLAAAEALVEHAERQQVALQVGHIERFNPAWVAAGPCLQHPRYVRAERTSNFTYRSTDIGVVLDLMIHDLELVLSIVDSSLRQVEAFGIGLMGDHEDAVQARLHFANGCIADLTASRINPTAQRTFQAWTPSGCTTIDLQQRQVIQYAPSPSLFTGESPVEQARRPDADLAAMKEAVFGQAIQVRPIDVPAGDALTAELQSFVDCVKTGQAPLVGGPQALAAMHAAHRVLESVATHQWNATPLGPVGPRPFAMPLPARKAA